MLALDIRQVSKRYRAGIRGCSAGVDALRDVDLQVDAGEVAGIVGAPGTGKSTLLLCASGAMQPDSGTVAWFGSPAVRRSPRCPTAYVPESSGRYPFFTVRDVLQHRLLQRALAPDERDDRVEDAIRAADLSDWGDARIAAVPVGVARRVDIAQELLSVPRLLIVDEPFAGVESVAQARIVELLRSLPLRGITVLMASRDGPATARACTRVLVISAGRLRGEIDSARFQPAGRVAEVPR